MFINTWWCSRYARMKEEKNCKNESGWERFEVEGKLKKYHSKQIFMCVSHTNYSHQQKIQQKNRRERLKTIIVAIYKFN